MFPKYRLFEDLKLFKKFKKLHNKTPRAIPKESINRSLEVVEHILHEAADLRMNQSVLVTRALQYMKENPTAQISDAIISAYEKL